MTVEVQELKGFIDRVEQRFNALRGLVNKKLKYEDVDDVETSIKDDGFNTLRKKW